MMRPILGKLVEPKHQDVRTTRGGSESYFSDKVDEDELVSHRLPPRPRLRIEGALKGGAPLDLLPVINDKGNIVPDFWMLPQKRDARGRWQSVFARTDTVRANAEAQGLRVRILTN